MSSCSPVLTPSDVEDDGNNIEATLLPLSPPPSLLACTGSSQDEIERNRSLVESPPPQELLATSDVHSLLAAQSAEEWLTRSPSTSLVASTAALYLSTDKGNGGDDENSPFIEAEALVKSPHRQSLRERLQESLLLRKKSEEVNNTTTSTSEDSDLLIKFQDDERQSEETLFDSSSTSSSSGDGSSGVLLSHPNEKQQQETTTSTTMPAIKQMLQEPTSILHKMDTHRGTILPVSRIGLVGSSSTKSVDGRVNMVKLHIYDLMASETVMQLPWGCHFPIGKCLIGVNDGLHALGTGAYHCGVEVNGVEYAFGANEMEGLSGVFTCIPKHSPGYEYRTTLDFGARETLKRSWIKVPKVELVEVPLAPESDGVAVPPPIEVNASSVYRQHATFVHGHVVMRQMAREYMGCDYDLLKKNCCTFARDACLRLGVSHNEIPTWFLNLADAGAVTKDMAETSLLKPISAVFNPQAAATATPPEFPTGIDRGFEVICDETAQVTVVESRGTRDPVRVR